MPQFYNIVYQTLLSKIRELEEADKMLDAKYKQDKRNVLEALNQLKPALDMFKDVNKDDIIAAPKRGRKVQEFDPNNYPFLGSLKNKMLFAIHDLNRFLHIREIGNYIIEKQPELNKTVIIDQIGKHIYKYKNNGTVVSYKAGSSHRNTFYGMPDWLDDKGDIISPHEYDKEALIDKNDVLLMQNSVFKRVTSNLKRWKDYEAEKILDEPE